LRYCPALAKKPGANPKKEPGPKPDPFQNPSADLLVAEIPRTQPSHILVLNKFPVIPNHFILATKVHKAQTDILEKEDLAATFACLTAWDGSNGGATTPRRLFAFFNSGEHSGASQPHRHLQFLPVEDMQGQEPHRNSDPWVPLIDRLSTEQAITTSSGYKQLPNLPFNHFALPIPPNPSVDTLHEIYMSLYGAARDASISRSDCADDSLDEERRCSERHAAISYNLAMTVSTMMICPRRQEHARLALDARGAQETADAGLVSLNGTILAGTLMVKAEAEWNALRNNSDSLNNILATVGFPAQSNGSSHPL
jgi:ATP adenylyltransferase